MNVKCEDQNTWVQIFTQLWGSLGDIISLPSPFLQGCCGNNMHRKGSAHSLKEAPWKKYNLLRGMMDYPGAQLSNVMMWHCNITSGSSLEVRALADLYPVEKHRRRNWGGGVPVHPPLGRTQRWLPWASRGQLNAAALHPVSSSSKGMLKVKQCGGWAQSHQCLLCN